MQRKQHSHHIDRRWPIALVAMATAIALLAGAVSTSGVVVALDRALGALVRAEWLSAPAGMSGEVSALAATDLILPVTAIATAVLVLARHWRGAVTLTLAVAATQGAVQLIKVTVARPRPAANDALAEAAGHSFPSAHSATAVALYATLAFLAARYCRGAARVAVLAAGAVVVLAIGVSRVHLGAHYPVDVLAGWLTGGVLVLASWVLVTRIATVRPQRAQY
jgi:undecaprenyl-diphosphatase